MNGSDIPDRPPPDCQPRRFIAKPGAVSRHITVLAEDMTEVMEGGGNNLQKRHFHPVTASHADTL